MRRRLAQHVGEESAADGHAGLDSSADHDPSALAGHAKAVAPNPQASGTVVQFKHALILMPNEVTT